MLVTQVVWVHFGLILVLNFLWLKSDWPFVLLGAGKTPPRIKTLLAVKEFQLGMENHLHWPMSRPAGLRKGPKAQKSLRGR